MLTLKALSHSSCSLLHSCPRKYLLTKCTTVPRDSTVDTAFGSAVGAGVQEWMITKDLDKALFACFLHWDIDLFEENPKSKKSLGDALLAVEAFSLLNPLKNFEIVYWKGKPAAELGFSLDLEDGFAYRGFADLVLKDSSGKIHVLDVKTSGSNAFNMNTFKNSGQVLGYDIILDAILGEEETLVFNCLYLVYLTSSRTWLDPAVFIKTRDHRVDWIRNILAYKEQITSYLKNDYFPLYGEACVSYGRDCKFLGVCDMQSFISNVKKDSSLEEEGKYQVETTLADVLAKTIKEF